MLESGENYLEAILMLEKENGVVHSVEVAEELGVTKASVSRAMSILREQGYLTFAPDNAILFTEKGREKAESVYERHRIIAAFLVRSLGADEKTAGEDACRFEHDVSEQIFSLMKRYVAGETL